MKKILVFSLMLCASTSAFAEIASFTRFEKEAKAMAESLPSGEDDEGGVCTFQVSRVRGGLYIEMESRAGRVSLQISERAEIEFAREIDPEENDGSFSDTYRVENVGSVTLVRVSDAYHYASLVDVDGTKTTCGQYY